MSSTLKPARVTVHLGDMAPGDEPRPVDTSDARVQELVDSGFIVLEPAPRSKADKAALADQPEADVGGDDSEAVVEGDEAAEGTPKTVSGGVTGSGAEGGATGTTGGTGRTGTTRTTTRRSTP